MKKSFFFITSILMTIIVLIGFSPSFLLRPLFTYEELPIAYIIHGTINLIWFVGLIYQTYMIAKGKIINHRKMGYKIFGWVILMLLSNLYIIYLTAIRYHAGELSLQAASGVTVGNMIGLLFSIIIISLAFTYRNKTKVHKRLIFIFSIGLLGFATDRIGRNIIPLTDQTIINGLVMSVIIRNLFYIGLIIYDIKKLKKPHYLTIIGILLPFINLAIIFLLLQNGFGEKFLDLFN
ncbi:hypothetical protein V8G61_03780 [Gaetbulibacter sp. M240]|uniref:hypothetical protein n=1 Tax=Gaetbulibacter sp. M240 TaxID=3126511 RepID=UPI00374F1D5E